MKKVSQGFICIVLLFSVSHPAKACTVDVAAFLLNLGTILTSGGVVPRLSELARDVAEQKLPPSDEKNIIQDELRTGTITYAISAVAATFALIFWVGHKTHKTFMISGILGVLALASSSIGMAVNGQAYHIAKAFFSDVKFDDMLGASIVGLIFHVASVSVLLVSKNRIVEAVTLPENV